MLICKNNRKFLKIIILQILNVFLITSCTLKDFKQNNDYCFNKTKNSFKTLIIPKGMSIPSQDKKYNIPYTKKDLEKENYDIFPPI